MASTYRVTFDFLEVVPYVKVDKPNAPYQSWGTEKIYVDADDGRFISLVHILEMRIVMKDGSISEPMITSCFSMSRLSRRRSSPPWTIAPSTPM